jgi:uncharacterized protein (TIGR03083 family)
MTAVDVITADSIADVYSESHDRIVALVRDLDDDAAQRPVPGTPRWTVHDVVAHLAAIPTDALAGRLGGVPTPEQTGKQVDDRRDRSISELLEEWAGSLGPMLEGARAGLVPAPLAIDAVTHEQDLRGALHLAHLDDDGALRFAATGYTIGVGRRLKEAGLPPLRLRDPARGFDAVARRGEPTATVSASEFELFRAMAGRRSRAQVAAFDWSVDPAPYLDWFCIFGPLAEQDVSD